MLRNHGLVDRDTVKTNGYNSRLDTFQAVVGNWLLPKAEEICNKRILNIKKKIRQNKIKKKKNRSLQNKKIKIYLGFEKRNNMYN